MFWFLLVCAVLGGTILACQFAMSLIGLDGDATDLADDIPDAHEGIEPGDGDGHADGAAHPDHSHASTWLFGVLSFRTLVAGTTFFGLGGLAANQADLSNVQQSLVAGISGLAAMFGVHWLMKQLGRLAEDGTQRIERAVGQRGTVYLTVPGAKSGRGKVHLKVQNRLTEFAALTRSEQPLKTGETVRVVAVVDGALEVVPLSQPSDAVADESTTHSTVASS